MILLETSFSIQRSVLFFLRKNQQSLAPEAFAGSIYPNEMPALSLFLRELLEIIEEAGGLMNGESIHQPGRHH